jgi:DNA-binding CsgD family transcriptional regulator
VQTRYAHSTRTREAVADFFPAGIHRAAGRVPAARPHHRTSSHGQHKADRGAIVEAFLNEKTDTVVDELEIIAKAHKTTVATVALAWVHAQPAVTSVIIGARRLAQLAEEISRLSALTEPSFGLPRTVLTTAQSVINNGTTTGWASLTPAELNVVRLVGEGLPNKDIAARLFVSSRTVQAHLSHVYSKLGLTSRVQLAHEATRHA